MRTEPTNSNILQIDEFKEKFTKRVGFKVEGGGWLWNTYRPPPTVSVLVTVDRKRRVADVKGMYTTYITVSFHVRAVNGPVNCNSEKKPIVKVCSGRAIFHWK